MAPKTNNERPLPLSEIYRRLEAAGLKRIDYKDLPYEALLKLVGGK